MCMPIIAMIRFMQTRTVPSEMASRMGAGAAHGIGDRSHGARSTGGSKRPRGELWISRGFQR